MRVLSLFAVAMVLAPRALADGLRLERPVLVEGSDLVLQYDDGVFWWMTNEHTYRGVWFNIEDFGQGLGWAAEQSQFWFYHHQWYPWDTALFYCELYGGDQSGPIQASLMDQTSTIALHCQPVFVDYSPAYVCGPDFWVVVNTEMSSSGYPTLLSDGSPNETAQSFYSDEFEVWEPWYSATQQYDYMIRSSGWQTALESATWGSIKTLF